MLICNKCGKTGKRGKFCVYCGGELSEFFTIKTVETDAEPTAECPECGKKFADGKFCIFCGTALRTIGGAAEDNVAVVQEMPAANETPVVEEPAPAVNEAPAEGGQLACVECGKIHERGKFCTACGGALRPVGAAVEAPAANETPVVEEPAPAVNEVPAEGGQLACVECGKIHERGKFCTACGGALRPVGAAVEAPAANETPVVEEPAPAVNEANAEGGQLVCVECGKIHERGKFCTACGGALRPVGAAVEAPAANETPVIEEPAPAVNEAPAEGGALVCPACGKVHERGKFCTVCGTSLEPMGTAPQPAPFIAPPPAPIPAPVPDTNAAPATGLVCPNCGKTFERGKFCTVCGTTLVAHNAQPAAPANSGQLHCSQCGKLFERGKFCTVCGGMLVTSDMMNV